MRSDLHETAAARLRQNEQRYTTNRRAIVTALAATGRPVTIPELLAARKGLPQSSAYRNLALLEAAGVVRRLVGAGGFARYELVEDLTEHHHHLICNVCGDVEQSTLPRTAESTVERALKRV